MKSNRNKIIKVTAFVTVACSLLCACNQTKPDSDTTEPSSSATVTVTEPAVTEPVTEQTTAEQTTAEQTTAKAPTRPSTTKPTSTAVNTTEKAEMTKPEHSKAPEEITTRHKNALANAAITADKIVGYRLISRDEIAGVASELADSSEIYYVRLQDGTNTFYIAVNLQTAQALALSNPRVLRELCRQLDEKQQLMADKDTEYVLMDYTHLVGELEIHYLGYMLTGALGAEDGPLSSFYRSCSVADLNIDESRFGPIIDVIGVIYG